MAVSRVLSALVLSLAAGSALAHGGHGGAHFGAGFAHPFDGLDHLLAMLAVGLVAARQDGAARWALPVGFVAAMVGGALLGAAGLALPAVEGGIAVSVLVLGAMVALLARLPLAAALPLVGLFALFHGHAHFAEMGEASLAAYAAGFVAATALLHGAGYLLGRWLPQARWALAAKRVLGAAIAGTGMVLLGA